MKSVGVKGCSCGVLATRHGYIRDGRQTGARTYRISKRFLFQRPRTNLALYSADGNALEVEGMAVTTKASFHDFVFFPDQVFRRNMTERVLAAYVPWAHAPLQPKVPKMMQQSETTDISPHHALLRVFHKSFSRGKRRVQRHCIAPLSFWAPW